MLILILMLIAAGLICAIWALMDKSGDDAEVKNPVKNVSCEGCTGGGACGGMGCHGESKEPDPIYFEDEELDAYIGRPAHDYTVDEVAAFKEVLYSMHDTEVGEWLESLRQRGINLPSVLECDVDRMLTP